ncbi:hypothetical protein PG997_003123 [Apiospora hydei]|uniref:Uncharacterized protein n=1 Tax=Apiospora hydei TaxID=1337664 RepID=A0ABR1WYD1_9PEZI
MVSLARPRAKRPLMLGLGQEPDGLVLLIATSRHPSSLPAPVQLRHGQLIRGIRELAGPPLRPGVRPTPSQGSRQSRPPRRLLLLLLCCRRRSRRAFQSPSSFVWADEELASSPSPHQQYCCAQ